MKIDNKISNTRTCEKCKASVPASKVKLFPRDAQRNWMLCEECCAKLKSDSRLMKEGSAPKAPKAPKVVVKLPQIPRSAQRPVVNIKKVDSPAPSKRPFFCTKCRYKFSLSTEKQFLRCPLCGESKFVQEIPPY